MSAPTGILVEFKPVEGTPDDGGWPCEIMASHGLTLGLTWNRTPLNSGEATYYDASADTTYVLTRLRSGHIVGVLPAPPARPEPKDGDEREENWGDYLPVKLRYSAKDSEWLVVGEAREDQRDGNAAVRYDQRVDRPETGNVPICDVLGGHVGWASWEEWLSWPILRADDEEAAPMQGEST